MPLTSTEEETHTYPWKETCMNSLQSLSSEESQAWLSVMVSTGNFPPNRQFRSMVSYPEDVCAIDGCIIFIPLPLSSSTYFLPLSASAAAKEQCLPPSRLKPV